MFMYILKSSNPNNSIFFSKIEECYDCSYKSTFMYLWKVQFKKFHFEPMGISLRLSIAAAIASVAVFPVNRKQCQL